MILIVGGAGYVGSHMNKLLSNKGFKTVVFDNLSTGYKDFVKWGTLYKGDLQKANDIGNVFKKFPIDFVMHFSACSLVGESVENPSKYYGNNVVATRNLLEVMREYSVSNIIFSSSAAVFGIPKKIPIKDTADRLPINPYGKTKVAIEWMLEDYSIAYNLNFVTLRYFNAAGADPQGDIGEKHDPETHLIPIVLDTALGKRTEVKIFGTDYKTPDGTAIRDYIHVNDLADAHLKALEYLKNGGKSSAYNLGLGKGFSVREVIETVKKVTKSDFTVIETDRRPGDPPILIADSTKARKSLYWKPKYTKLDDIISTAWNWHKKA